MVNEKVEPRPSSDSTRIRPPCPSTICRAIDEAEARPAAPHTRPVGLVEALEDAVTVGRRDADAMVDDGNLHGVGGMADEDPDLAPVGAELHRVVDEVDDDLAQARLVAADLGDPGLHRHGQRHALALGEQPQAFHGAFRQAADVHAVRHVELAPALDAGEVQELVDHLDQVAGLDLDLGDAVAHPGRDVVRLGLARQRLGEEADRGQRRPELVAQVVDERGADALEAAELGHVLQDHQQTATVEARGAQGDDTLVRLGQRELGHRRPAGGDACEEGLDPGVQEGLHDGPADESAGADPEELVGTGVRAHDATVHESKDAHGKQVVGRAARQGGRAGCPGGGLEGGPGGWPRRRRPRPAERSGPPQPLPGARPCVRLAAG